MSTSSTVVDDDNEFDKKSAHFEKAKNDKKYKIELVWPRIIIIGYLHIAAVHGLYRVFTSAKLATTLYAIFLYQITIWGVTLGAHRLWAHRCYKAKWPLRLLLMVMFTTAYQHSVISWSRDHRVHHKHSDTDADPYNPKRGFFFSHVGWLLCKKHPDVYKKGAGIDMSDLYDDQIVRFQHKYHTILMALCSFILPTLIPAYFWNESYSNAFLVAAALRWTVTVNVTSLVNSVAHMYGNRPYDKSMSSVENLTTAMFTGGEAWHNYHHAFPWDYKASELGRYWCNTSLAIIDFMARIGLAYDLKTVSPDLIKKRVERTGDGSHGVWGWDDKDMTKEDREAAIIVDQK